MPRSYDTYTKIWIRKELRDRLEELRERLRVSFNDLIHAWLEVYEQGLGQLEGRFQETLIRLKAEREVHG
ncbi:MAG: hypothetical protein DRJ97_07800 [Thermoprotei archaeon]|nr:MAG: hypothetical protein DRJ97_07800 [Thermoprotei archaeon]